MTERRRRSRSTSRGRHVSGPKIRTRSSSRDGGRSSVNKRPCTDFNDCDGFFVPFRCLIPPDCAGVIIGKGGSVIDRLSKESKALISILSANQNPKGLADRILSISGSLKSRESALHSILALIRDYFRKSDHEKDLFVCLIPEHTAPLVIGHRGNVLSEITDRTKCYLSVSQKSIPYTTDRPVTMEGSVKAIVAAFTRINTIIQAFYDSGKLSKSDFLIEVKTRTEKDTVKDVKTDKPDRTDRAEKDNKADRTDKSIDRANRDKTDKTVNVAIPDSFDSTIPFVMGTTEEESDWATQSIGLSILKELENEFCVKITISDSGLYIVGTHGAKKSVIKRIVTSLKNDVKRVEHLINVLTKIDLPNYEKLRHSTFSWDPLVEKNVHQLRCSLKPTKEMHAKCPGVEIVTVDNSTIQISGSRQQIALAVFTLLASDQPNDIEEDEGLDYSV